MIGVVVFVGLTAYDTQRIKNDYIEYAYAEGSDEAAKRSVFDALGLYLNFVNLFQLLLQFMGVRSRPTDRPELSAARKGPGERSPGPFSVSPPSRGNEAARLAPLPERRAGQLPLRRNVMPTTSGSRHCPCSGLSSRIAPTAAPLQPPHRIRPLPPSSPREDPS